MSTNPQPTVLIVEDDLGVAFLQRRTMERAGFTVLTASAAAEAIEVVQRGGIDLVVLDYRLPGEVSGLDCHNQLREHGQDLPVIIVTGSDDGALVIKALRQGVRDFVPKTAEYLDYLPEAARRVLAQVDVERRLAESEARFQSFMDNSPAAAFIKDADGRWIYANEVCKKISELPADWQGKTDFELFPDSAAELRGNDLTVLEKKSAGEFVEESRVPGGELRQWQSFKFPIHDSDGRVSLGGVALEITERRRAEELLHQRDEQLRQVQKMDAIGTLAGGVAHEFNNLLQAMQAYTEFALEEIPVDSQPTKDLGLVLKAIERAGNLTKQLLGFGRRQMLQFKHIDPNQSVNELLGLLRPLIGAHIKLEVSLDGAVGTVHADPAHLQQLIMNLCLNARDAMPEGGQLTVKTENIVLSPDYCEIHADLQPGRHLLLTVADTGHGMTAEVQKHIFEPFFTTKAVGKGTGLGLAMAYGVVQQHRGNMCVYSEPKVGTVFKIYLPTSDREASLAVTEKRKYTGGSETILIAEDDPFVRDIAARILKKAGYKTFAAADGAEATRMFEEHAATISLALLDVVMPEYGGREVFQRIQAIKPSVKAVFCSGYDPETAALGFVSADNMRLVQKPFDPHVLLQTIREVLDGPTVMAAASASKPELANAAAS